MWGLKNRSSVSQHVRSFASGGILEEQTFWNIVRTEKERADRSGVPVTVAIFTVQHDESNPASFPAYNAAALCSLLRKTARMTDHVGIAGDSQLGVVLWGTRDLGAYRFVNRLSDAASQLSSDCRLFVYPTVPEEGTAKINGSVDEILSRVGQPGRQVLDRIADVEDKLAQALDVETPVVKDQDITHDDDSLQFGDEETQDSPALNVKVEPLEKLFLNSHPWWKRTMDVVGAACGLIVLSPVLLSVAAVVKATSPGPILFRQTREGHGGRLFTINKFRTMRVGADAEKAALQAKNEQHGPAFKMEHDPRITPVGSFLRKTCLDELPQLWNVLVGDMALVGPRPLDYRESSQIARWGRRRLNVMPGLTCIWQVHGKSNVSFNEWMRMDIRYARRISLTQDLRLVLATLKQMLLRKASQ